jgi:hypothetical protein
MEMKQSIQLLVYGIAILGLPIYGEEDAKIVSKPLSIAALQEFGQLTKGIYKIGPGNSGEVWTNDWMDHFGTFVTKEAIINDRLFLSGGLGGVFQFRKPENVSAGFYGSQRRGFFIGPTKALVEYHFGDPEQPYLTVGSGMFMYKYNSDALNLGEYLYRSGAYPEYTVTGGYVVINSAAANLQGFKSSLNLGAFKADLLLTTETNLAPLYDWSIGLIASYTVADGLMELGAGINLKRFISVSPERTSPHSSTNGYFTKGGQDYTTNTNYYDYQIQFYNNRNTSLDSLKAKDLQVKMDTVLAMNDPTYTGTRPDTSYYSNAGTLVMARASLDFKKIFDADLFGPQDLKLYSEAALLGIKDYPIFYTKKSQRIPVMVGFNFPGFKLLDLFAVQVEHLNTPWLNNTSQIANDGVPLPIFPKATDAVASKTEWNDLATRDDWKWSVLIQKKLGRHITLSAQAANDHMRVVSSRYFYGPQFDHNEVTVSPDHWYWMTQLAWGI